MSVSFAIFLNTMMGGTLDTRFFTLDLPYLQIPVGTLQVVAISIIAFVTLINFATVSVSGNVAALLTGIKIALVLAVGIGAFIYMGGDWTHFASGSAAGRAKVLGGGAHGSSRFGAAMLGALWAYNGWNT